MLGNIIHIYVGQSTTLEYICFNLIRCNYLANVLWDLNFLLAIKNLNLWLATYYQRKLIIRYMHAQRPYANVYSYSTSTSVTVLKQFIILW